MGNIIEKPKSIFSFITPSEHEEILTVYQVKDICHFNEPKINKIYYYIEPFIDENSPLYIKNTQQI